MTPSEHLSTPQPLHLPLRPTEPLLLARASTDEDPGLGAAERGACAHRWPCSLDFQCLPLLAPLGVQANTI